MYIVPLTEPEDDPEPAAGETEGEVAGFDGDEVATGEDRGTVTGCFGGTGMEDDATVVGVDVPTLLAMTPEVAKH